MSSKDEGKTRNIDTQNSDDNSSNEYIKTRFKFSNNIVQLNFKDYEVILKNVDLNVIITPERMITHATRAKNPSELTHTITFSTERAQNLTKDDQEKNSIPSSGSTPELTTALPSSLSSSAQEQKKRKLRKTEDVSVNETGSLATDTSKSKEVESKRKKKKRSN
ncbi:uncharacterized protein KGF55_001837 [Candida pseudojiufengensis]|uniref:uncharacterized protein n=1 Tax=Candida pseudojiufengensis TaxID=497109 RepID=UPI0022248DAF|nr:uncharacterized protein KGF55_001837 [Candida pseudojiufengensis]KAI5964767.1 hypothetical protein KGF55_001837 [Candida pseudojiufengensis]